MHRSFTRLAAAATVTASLLSGGLLLAPAANAATPVQDSPFRAGTFVGTVKHHHLDTLRVRPEGKVTARFDGETVYRDHTVVIRHGKHVLFERKHVSAARAAYIAGRTFGERQYKTDAALVGAARAAANKPYPTVLRYELATARHARIATVQSDVNVTKVNVAFTLVDKGSFDPVADAAAISNSQVRGRETVTVNPLPDNNFEVIAVDAYDHITIRYSSVTDRQILTHNN